jgi:murein DD-endopeptidase MepM/ murein hydrolase activator NlpD
VANHRAGKRQTSPVETADRSTHTDRRAAPAGKRRAVRPAKPARALPSAPTLVGAAALVIAAGGAVSIGHGAGTGTPAQASAGSIQRLSAQATVLSGSSRVQSSDTSESRQEAVSRDSQREALQDAADEELQAAAEAQAKERNAALAQLAASAEKHADDIAANAWALPIAAGAYRLSAGFGQSSGLWATTHTGLDFAAPSGTPIMAVTSGVVTSAEYSGAYGNRTVVTNEDGTEIWYCHQTSFGVSPGDTVRGGQTIGTVGSTGNSTGPHLHLEVRPGAGDPVDPAGALTVHGLTP